MGFCSFISSCISSCCSAIGGALSSVGSAIGSLCSSIGGALFGGVAALAASILGPIVSLPLAEILLTVGTIAKIVGFIAEALGLKEENETPEELAMKAEQADKKPEDFDSTEAYIEYLRKEVEVDKEKLKNLTNEERLTYKTIGTSLYIKEIEEKYGVKMPGEFWLSVKKMNMDGKEVQKYIESFKEHGLNDMGDMVCYMKGLPLDDSKDRSKVSGAMLEALKELHPEMKEEDLIGKLLDMKLEK